MHNPRTARFLTSPALALSVGGALPVSLGMRWGFALWAVANVLWGIDAWQRRHWSQLALWTFYEATAVLGLVRG